MFPGVPNSRQTTYVTPNIELVAMFTLGGSGCVVPVSCDAPVAFIMSSLNRPTKLYDFVNDMLQFSLSIASDVDSF